jgi:integrase/recombinase XerD
MSDQAGLFDGVDAEEKARQEALAKAEADRLAKEAAEKAGIEQIVSPHTFRHSFATHLLEGGADLKAIQDMLGHESILTTEIYTHLDTDYLRDTIMRYHPRNRRG